MPLVQVLFTLIVVGVILWLINRFIPMAGSIKSILNAVVVIGVVFKTLAAYGKLDHLAVDAPELHQAQPIGRFQTEHEAPNP